MSSRAFAWSATATTTWTRLWRRSFRLEPCSADGAGHGAELSHSAPAYRRALWLVVQLNIGYGVVEAVGGFLTDFQALKAYALDFRGDGLITLLGLLAFG